MSTLNNWFNDLKEENEETPEYLAESLSIELAFKISEKMAELELSQVELSKILKVSKSYINQILQGHNNMTLLTICKLATALKLKPVVRFDEKVSKENTLSQWFTYLMNESASEAYLSTTWQKLFEVNKPQPKKTIILNSTALSSMVEDTNEPCRATVSTASNF